LDKFGNVSATKQPIFYNANMKKSESKSRGPAANMIWVYALVVVLLGIMIYALLNTKIDFKAVGSSIPNFSFNTFDGETIQFSSLPQKIRVVHFWASWCATCQEESPVLEEAWDHYRSGEDVIFLGLAASDTESDARAFFLKSSLTYPNGLDEGDRISDLFTVMAIPGTVIVDQRGVILFRQAGSFSSSQQIIQLLDKLLADSP